MKFKYYIFLASKNLFHKKISILNILLLVIVITMLIIVSSFSKTLKNLINNQVNGNLKHKIILVNRLESEDKLALNLENIEGISYIANYNTYSQYVSTNNGEILSLIGIPDDYLAILNGKNFDETDENKVLICPANFYLGDNPEEFNEEFLTKIHNGVNYLDKFFTITSNLYKEKYKIIGIYDENKYSYGEYNVCYTRQDNILEIYNSNRKYIEELCEDDTNCNIQEPLQMIVVVNNYDNISDIEKQIQNMGYQTTRISDVNTTGIDFIILILIVISVFILITTFIILLISNNKFIQYNKKNNLIYKQLGYDKNILIKINYLESIIITFVSFIISIIICLVLYIIVSNNYGAQIKLQMPLCISYLAIIISFLLTLGISLLSWYLAIKNNNSIIGEFRDAEI